jgi:hypothetical protein
MRSEKLAQYDAYTRRRRINQLLDECDAHVTELERLEVNDPRFRVVLLEMSHKQALIYELEDSDE